MSWFVHNTQPPQFYNNCLIRGGSWDVTHCVYKQKNNLKRTSATMLQSLQLTGWLERLSTLTNERRTRRQARQTDAARVSEQLALWVPGIRFKRGRTECQHARGTIRRKQDASWEDNGLLLWQI